MKALQALLLILWIVIVTITWRAFAELGSDGGMVFITDFGHPWRAQFNTDFSIHALLLAIWVFWREKSKLVGMITAALCMMGGVFTLPYFLFAIYRAKGDVKTFLLGAHNHP